MADTKITAMTEKTTPAKYDDIILVRDDDVTEFDANGTTRQATMADFQGKVLIDDSQDNTSTAGSFAFSSIPTTFNRLIISGFIRSDKATVNVDDVIIYLNGVTATTNYKYMQMMTKTGPTEVVVDGTGYTGPEIPAADSPANSYAYFEAILEDYANTSNAVKTVYWRSGAKTISTTVVVGSGTVTYSSTSAITSITVDSTADDLFGYLRLYGEN